MRIAGQRISPPYARLLARVVADAGYGDTATKLTDAIEVQAIEPALTIADYDAIVASLEINCPPGLAKLRRELVSEQMRWRLSGL